MNSKLVVLGSALVLSALAGFAKPAVGALAPVQEGERIVFLGDSITYYGWTVDFLQTYWAMRHPGSKTTFINSGIGGDDARGGIARFDREVVAFKPSRVFMMFGMNDGNKALYRCEVTDKVLEERRRRIETYGTNMTTLVRMAKAAGIEPVLITPSPHDNGPENPSNPYRWPDQGPDYNKLCLAKMAEKVRAIAAKEGCGLVELHKPLTKAIEQHRELALVGHDRTHPDRVGYLFFAGTILDALGEPAAFGGLAVDAGGKTSVEADYSAPALPFPRYPEYDVANTAYPFTARHNEETLRVENLPEGVYSVCADGKEIAVVTGEQLTNGINLALLDTPNQLKAKGLFAVAEQMNGVTRAYRDIMTKVCRRQGDYKDYTEEKLEAARRKIEACREVLRNARPTAWKLSIAPKNTDRPVYTETGADGTAVWKTVNERAYDTDFCVVGGGLAGECAAVAAARNGAKVVLVQDRPMLGGNASSEIRVPVAGALGDVKSDRTVRENREVGIVEELFLRNLYLNPRREFTLWDHVQWDFLTREPNIKVLLNTSVNACATENGRIVSVTGWNSHSYTKVTVRAKIFADCSGDGILRLSGAKFMYGREPSTQFGESYARPVGSNTVMGTSLIWSFKPNVAEDGPVPPFSTAYWYPKGLGGIPKKGYPFSWTCGTTELGGMGDTIGDADWIRDQQFRYTYGYWKQMKEKESQKAAGINFCGSLPGKRESVRFVGDHILTQNDLLAEGRFPDTIGHGGWSMDDHFSEGFFSTLGQTIFRKCPHVYGIPYRSLYSVNVENLMFAGRDVSVTHLALASTRVMATCAVMGQAVGTAAAIAVKKGTTPRGVYREHLEELLDTLQWQDQYVPFRPRKITALTLKGRVSDAHLIDGVERDLPDEAEHGAWLADGESCSIEWDAPEKLKGVRIVFDSDFTDLSNFRLRIWERDNNNAKQPLPKMLARDFVVEGRLRNRWTQIKAVKDNHRRYVDLDFGWLRQVDAVRLTVRSTWSAGESKAHVYSFEAY